MQKRMYQLPKEDQHLKQDQYTKEVQLAKEDQHKIRPACKRTLKFKAY